VLSRGNKHSMSQLQADQYVSWFLGQSNIQDFGCRSHALTARLLLWSLLLFLVLMTWVCFCLVQYS